MSRNLTSADRARIVTNAGKTLDYLRTIPHQIHQIREAVDLRIDDGMRSATYDGDGRHSASSDSTPERVVLSRPDRRSDQACEALADLDRGLTLIAEGDALVDGVIKRYPIFDGKAREHKPGKGLAPVGQCEVCWANGTPEPNDDRYKRFCRWCGDWFAQHHQRPPSAIWRVHHVQGKRVTTADLRKHAPHLLPAS